MIKKLGPCIWFNTDHIVRINIFHDSSIRKYGFSENCTRFHIISVPDDDRMSW